jgi:hypothetical protein
MSSLRRPLRGVIGGIKEHMDAINLTIGGICVPLGFYLIVEKPELKAFAAVVIILGVAAWLVAYWAVRSKVKQERVERIKETVERRAEHLQLVELLTGILQEIRRANQDKR